MEMSLPPEGAQPSNADGSPMRGLPSSQLFSRTIAGQLFGEEDASASPRFERLRSPASTVENRQQFERNQREIVRGIVEQSPLLFCCLGILLLAYFVIFRIVLVIAGWVVYISHGSEPCDQPLATWLPLTLCEQAIVNLLKRTLEILNQHEYISVEGKNVLTCLANLLPFVLLGIGVTLFFHAETCPKTNPSLYSFIELYLICVAVNIVAFMASLLTAGVLIYGFWQGWFDDQVQGADSRTIEMLETVVYDPSLFAEEGNVDDDRPAGDCCCCMLPFGADMVIKQTPCHHYFHETCLRTWLVRSRTCPLCRVDLEEAVKGLGAQP